MGQASERDFFQEARRDERGQLLGHRMHSARRRGDDRAELGEARERLRLGWCGGQGQGADTQLHLLPLLENRADTIHQLLGESGQSLLSFLHGRLKLRLGEGGPRIVR